MVYDVTTSGACLAASLFNVTIAPKYHADGPYYSAARIQGIPGAQSGTGGANASISAVPKPSSIAMGLMGAAGFGALTLMRRRRLRSRTPCWARPRIASFARPEPLSE